MKVNFPDKFSRKSSVVEEVLQDEDLHPVQVREEKPDPDPAPEEYRIRPNKIQQYYFL